MKHIKIKLAGLLLCFCSLTIFGQTGESKYVLRVNIESAPVEKVYYGIMNDRMTITRQDSIRPKNGQFVLRGKGPLPLLVNFYIPGTSLQEIILILVDSGVTEAWLPTGDWSRYRVSGSPAVRAYFDFQKEYAEAEAIKTRNALAIPFPKFRNDTVEGKPVTRVIPTFNCYLLKTDTVEKERIPSYSSLLGQERDNGRINFQNAQTTATGDLIINYYGDSSYLHLNRVAYKYLMLNRDNNIGALVAYQHFVRSHYTKEVDSAYDLLGIEVRNSRFGKSLNKYIGLNSSRKAVDFSFTDITGKRVRLSDLKSEYILVHFWASWCGSCRPPNRELADLYRRTDRDRLEIINISLDNSRADWQKAIKTDGLPGYHSSELNGFDNTIAGKYNVRAIPSSYLLDSKGDILLINPGQVSFIENTIQSGKP